MVVALLSSCPIVAQNLPFGFPKTDRTKMLINQGWRFHLGDAEAKYYTSDLDDSSWESVNIPHTLKLTSLTLDMMDDEKTQLKFHREVGWYRKNLMVNSSDKKVFLEFEGAHQITMLWVNGQEVGQHAVGGYSPFHFDITDYVKKGENNQVTLLVDNRRSEIIPPDPGPFDYVKFSGLYRDVYVVETNPVHVTFNWETMNSGVHITTPTIDPVNKNATINIKTAVRNESNKTIKSQLITRIIDQDGIVVSKMIDTQSIASGQEYQFNQIESLEDNVRLWGIDDPYLYRVNSVVMIDGRSVDFVENKLGLRKFEQDPVRGFILNGQPIELIGFNRHQHFPYVGDAVPNSLHYKDMLQLKEYGFNSMRCAHYPHDDALIDACDELGILVYEEAPTWISISQNSKWWDNLEQSARVMVRNHRNHPSVVIWGGGVNHRGYVPRVHNAIKQEDPTRLTASQGARWTGWQASGLTDINANMLYGLFMWDRSEPIFAMEGKHGPAAVAPFKRDPMMTGLLSWTAHAYYTFHPEHAKAKDPRDRTRSGAMTMFRYARPEFEWYKTELLDEPMVYILNDWKEGVDEVTVYSNAPVVELILNGKSLGKKKPSQDTSYLGLDHPPFHFKDLTYQPGKLTAKAFFENSTLTTTKQTPGTPYAIQLRLDTAGRSFVADGNDILMAYASIVDKNGTIVTGTDHKIAFTIKGDATVVGDGTTINANPMFTEYGVAPALIRAGTNTGEITVFAKCKGLKMAAGSVALVESEPDIVLSSASSIYDFKTERIDLGAPDQLTQFGWYHWNGTDDAQNSYSLKHFSDASISLKPATSNGVMRWLGEMNIVGKYGFAYGDGVIVIDDNGLDLVLDGLPKGTYKLSSWHHAPSSNSDSMDPNKEKLKSLTIHKLPYEKIITINSESIVGDNMVTGVVTEGKSMQSQEPGKSTIIFESDGNNSIRINISGKEGKGIWLNALELSEWR